MSIKEDLKKSINASENGLALSALVGEFPDTSRRTLQRHLKNLVDQQQIEASGKGRARIYRGISKATASTSDNTIDAMFSADSAEILRYINQPITERTPVGYQFEFLEEYQPNKTHYLSKPLRKRLWEMGKTDPKDAPAGTYTREILNRLLIDLSWASSQLEGNTYSILDTRTLIEQGTAAKGKDAIETQMILNHKSSIEFLVDNIDTVKFDRHTILNLHSILSENLLANPADEGRIRQQAVDITSSAYRPLSVPSQVELQFDLILKKADVIKDAFEQSFFIMVHLPYLQPFIDVNKRTSRLAANLSLFRANLCPLTFLGLPENSYTSSMIGIYETTRVEALRDVYAWSYERSTQEYLSIKQNMTAPDPLRLEWRSLIKQTMHEVLVKPELDPLPFIRSSVAKVALKDRENIEALIIEEMRRVHVGVLARYGVTPSQFSQWVAVHRKNEQKDRP